MKKITPVGMLISILTIWAVNTHAQTLVNQYILDTLGHPSVIFQYIKAMPISGTNDVAIMTNTFNPHYSSANDNFYLIKVSRDSGFINGAGYIPAHGGIDFGTNLCVKDGYAYMVGFTTDSVLSHSYLCNLFKINLATFDTAWTVSTSIDSSIYQQAPFSVLADNAGNVYMGASVQTATSYKAVVIKYDSTGTKIWQANYDTTGFYTIPVAMALNVTTASLAVTGFSFDSLGNSNFVTVNFSTSTGTRYGYSTSANGRGMISHPVGIIADSSDNSYIAGTSTVSGTKSVIKVVGYASNYSQRWVSTYGDSSQTNTAAAMSMNNVITGVICVTGTVPNTSGGSSITTLRYNIDGSLAWASKLDAPNPAYAASGVSITNDPNGNTYVTGTVFNGSDSDIITGAYDISGNLLWSKIFSRTLNSNDIPYCIVVNGNSVFVTAKSVTATDSLYITLEYDTYTKTDTITTSTSGGQYMNNEIIVRFDPNWVNQSAVNNIDIDFAPPSYWLTPTAISALDSVLPFDMSQCTMERIYKGLKATYKYSIARNGDTIPIPNLWAGFLLMHPYSGKGTEKDIATDLNHLFPMVVYPNLNYVGQFMGGCYNPDPHPVSCRINDYYFGYSSGIPPQQQNLWDDSLTNGYYSYGFCQGLYNINIDSAWRLETGKPFVKTGIYDTYVEGTHQDFSPNPTFISGRPSNPSSKANGWDFYTGTSRPVENWANSDLHGTAVAGFVGAIRNNGIGVAGIAGGSYTDTMDVGVTIYDMSVVNATADAVTLPMATLSNALVFGCQSVPDSGYGFGLHVINNSWIMEVGGDYASSIPQLTELELAFKTVYKNQTIIVAAAGNTATTYGFPANFYNDWIICVGGADDSGKWYNSGVHNYSASAVGSCVDIIAPSYSGNGYTATTLGSANYSNYNTGFYGTSMAAPHVTGTVSLLMSYLDSSISVYKNLSPEDAEHLLTRSADNMGYVGHSDSAGWGGLNAGRALQSVNKRCIELVHLGKGNNTNAAGTLIKAFVHIKPTERFTNPYTGITYDTIPYLCIVYKESNTMSQHLDTNFVIADYWTRPSSTSLLLAWDSVNGTLKPFEHLYVDSISARSATISGYYYVLYGADSFTVIGYWGADSGIVANQDSFRFDYTLLLNNPTVSCYPVDTATSIKEIKNTAGVSFHPNPVEDAAWLDVYTSQNTRATIEIIDLQGRIMEAIYNGELIAGYTSLPVNTKPLSSGIYTISIKLEDQSQVVKFVKYNP